MSRATDADAIRLALDLGLQAWRTTPSRQRFIDATDALARMEDQLCTLLAEREFGPQPHACPNPACPLVTCGDGYDACPTCGGALVPAARQYTTAR